MEGYVTLPHITIAYLNKQSMDMRLYKQRSWTLLRTNL